MYVSPVDTFMILLWVTLMKTLCQVQRSKTFRKTGFVQSAVRIKAILPL